MSQKMDRPAFVHVQEGNHWRVYPALWLRDTYCAGKLQPKSAELMYIDDSSAIRIVDTQHYDDRISAVYWVLLGEFWKLAEDIEADWNQRHLWREAKEDVERIRPFVAGWVRHDAR